MNVGIAGAGLVGRLAAWALARQGHQVSVFDPAPGPQPRFDGHQAAGLSAAGMLSPLAERETADADLAALGWQSIALWQDVTAQLQGGPEGAPGEAPLMHRAGSLLVAHGPDLGAARRMLQHLDASTTDGSTGPQALQGEQLSALEPDLAAHGGTLHAWLLPGEGQIDTVRTLEALHRQAHGVHWHWQSPVQGIEPGTLSFARNGQVQQAHFDWVIDARGAGAAAEPGAGIRGVRGELVWLHAPEVRLHRPVRLLHPRHRVYIVPRAGGRLILGASEIESQDRGPVTLRSAVELMAAAHSVLPGLAEARIERLDVNLRPATPDHRPHLRVTDGQIRLNGLYRHGWLLAPALLKQALQRSGLAPHLHETNAPSP